MSLPRSVRASLGRALGDVLARACRHLPCRTFNDGKTPYLSRYYVTGAPTMDDGSSPFDRFGSPKKDARFHDKGVSLFIHRFHRSDKERECHSHPWSWALSFVVAGGYSEERRVGDSVVRRLVPPLSLNRIMADDFHRVDLLEHDAWTIFLAGPKASSWSFWDRDTGELTPWREFLARKQRLEEKAS